MPPTNPTTAWRYANSLVEGGIDAFIANRRKAKKSWYRIALELYRVTDGEIEVTPETIRAWTQKGEAA